MGPGGYGNTHWGYHSVQIREDQIWTSWRKREEEGQENSLGGENVSTGHELGWG